MKKLIALIFMVAIVSTAFAISARVTAQTLNVRSEPSKSGSVVGTLQEGDFVDMDECENGFCSVAAENLQGYASEKFLEPFINEAASEDEPEKDKWMFYRPEDIKTSWKAVVITVYVLSIIGFILCTIFGLKKKYVFDESGEKVQIEEDYGDVRRKSKLRGWAAKFMVVGILLTIGFVKYGVAGLIATVMDAVITVIIIAVVILIIAAIIMAKMPQTKSKKGYINIVDADASGDTLEVSVADESGDCRTISKTFGGRSVSVISVRSKSVEIDVDGYTEVLTLKGSSLFGARLS